MGFYGRIVFGGEEWDGALLSPNIIPMRPEPKLPRPFSVTIPLRTQSVVTRQKTPTIFGPPIRLELDRIDWSDGKLVLFWRHIIRE
jgi:hypothetical protein